MVRRQMWTIAALAIVCSTRLAAATDRDSVHVTVRVYRPSEDEGWLQAALAQADALLSAASVKVQWVSCGGDGVQPLLCRVPPAVGDLAVRVTPGSGAHLDVASMPLGDSLIDRRANAGTLATIYATRVVWLAGESHVSVATLAGRAIAHELGHLLMATTAHDATGLMRAHWTVPELAHDDPRDWMFTAADAKAIRRRAARDTALREARLLARSVSSSSAAVGVDAE